MSLEQRVRQAFQERYGQQPPIVVRAPGRVSLLGGHTDYNEGFVLAMAIERAVWLAARPRHDRQVAVHSLDFDRTVTFSLDNFQHDHNSWSEYVKGMAWSLQEAGYRLSGWEGVLVGDVPIGAGLSSSAALELATARTFAAVGIWPWRPTEMAKLAQRAENQWVGVNCGILDQMISAHGREGYALLLDARSLNITPIPLPPDTAVVILDTTTRRDLLHSGYNERRKQCEAAADFFGVRALRDLTVEAFEERADEMEPLLRRRTRHVVTENWRVLQAAEAMRRGDPVRVGELMNESHISLRDNYEVANEALDVMTVCAQQQPGCYGAHMTGAGWGGCAVALVQADQTEAFAAATAHCYQAEMGREPNIYISGASGGADLVIG